MTLDDEIREKITQLPGPPEVVDNWEGIADELSDSFYWIGSKIDWSKAYGHKTLKLHEDNSVWLAEIKEFIHEYNIDDVISHSNNVFYVNDSSLDFSVKLNHWQFDRFIEMAIKEIPQHHYFFERISKWCLVITSEGYIDFGLSIINTK